VRSTLTAVLPRWLAAASIVAASIVVASIVTGSIAATASVATGDTRTVERPHVPDVCQQLPAQLATSDRTFDAAAEDAPPDTARIQGALTACAGTGQAVELVADGANRAFLSGPLSIGSSVTLVIDAGVTLYATTPSTASTATATSAPSTTASGSRATRPAAVSSSRSPTSTPA
jgi:polygalacturonase